MTYYYSITVLYYPTKLSLSKLSPTTLSHGGVLSLYLLLFLPLLLLVPENPFLLLFLALPFKKNNYHDHGR